MRINTCVVEVAAHLSCRRDVHFGRGATVAAVAIRVLDHVLVASPEEQLVAIVVEVREEHRAAHVSTDIVVALWEEGEA